MPVSRRKTSLILCAALLTLFSIPNIARAGDDDDADDHYAVKALVVRISLIWLALATVAATWLQQMAPVHPNAEQDPQAQRVLKQLVGCAWLLQSEPMALAATADGQRLFIGDWSGVVTLWDRARGQAAGQLRLVGFDHREAVQTISVLMGAPEHRQRTAELASISNQ